MRRITLCLLAWLCAVQLGACVALAVQTKGPPDLTNNQKVDRKLTYNLGATGMRGWIYTKAASNLDSQQGRTTTAARQILVTHVGKDSPADGVVDVDDVILGVDGNPFDDDARKQLAWAIQQAETETVGGVLKLTRWRKGEATEVQLKLRVMGTYSPTAPYDCPKSKRIFEEACRVLEQEPLAEDLWGAVNGLALMATGKADYLPRVQEFARKIAPRDLKLKLKPGMVVWEWGYRNLFLCEYYLLTGDKEVLPAIREYTTALAKGQSMYGTFGHGISGRTEDGKLHGSIPPYGPVNAAGLVGNLAVVMGHKCGVKDPEIEPAIERASKFFGYFVDKGAIPYGEHMPWPSHENNGKNAMTAMLFAVQANRIPETKFFAQMVTASYNNREYGHTGQGFSYLWGALGANTGGPAAAAAFFRESSWHFDLARRSDGSFTYDGGEQYGPGETDDNTYFGKSSYYGLSPAATYVLTYSLPLKKICLTGRDANPKNWLSPSEVSNAITSGRFDLDRKSKSVNELLTAFSDWSPVVRSWAAEELASRPDLATVIPELRRMAGEKDNRIRQSASESLGRLRVTDALPILVSHLSHPDRWVRFKAAEAIGRFGNMAAPILPDILRVIAETAEPLQPINWDDPIQLVHGQLAEALFEGPLSESLKDVDTSLLYPAIRAIATNADGMARAKLRNFFEHKLTVDDVQALAPDIYAAVKSPSPADTMFGNEIRMGGFKALAKYNFREAIELGVLFAKTQGGHGSESRTGEIMQEVARFGSAAKDAIPSMKELIADFNSQCKRGEFPGGELNNRRVSAVEAAIEAIESATTHPELRSVKKSASDPASNRPSPTSGPKPLMQEPSSSDSAEAPPSGNLSYKTIEIEGWSVLVSEQLLERDKEATELALKLLTKQLQEINEVVPAAAVAELHKVPLWLSPEYPKVEPRAEYHPGADWLRENKRDPAMEKAVEFTNVRIFEQETARMPNFALHELAHAYHDRVLADGFGNRAIKDAFKKAKADGLYDNVEQRFGDGRSAKVRAYAMTNPQEYFAECSEAFFSTNDFYPFTRDQLAKYDPRMCELLKNVWRQTDAAVNLDESRPRTQEKAYSDWKYSGSLFILTTPDGADLPESASLENFPLLVRLNKTWFEQPAGSDPPATPASATGDDIRFSTANGQPLAYQIEEWDTASGNATIWVRIPRITGNSRQEIRMHWGNPKASCESSGAAVFNESYGYASVLHLTEPVTDEVGSVVPKDERTTATRGMIGSARHFAGGQGIFGGEEIKSLPSGVGPMTTEAWFRADRANGNVICWGKEQRPGKIMMQFESPPSIAIRCYFADVEAATPVALDQWYHVVHTYQEKDSRVYVNGRLDGASDPLLDIPPTSSLWIGGWYGNYDFHGDVDEVRISRVVRSPDWIRLQYENQKPLQTTVGHLVQPGDEFSVSETSLQIAEGQSATVSARAGGAQKVYWLLKQGDQETIIAVDQFSYSFNAGRVTGDTLATLQFKAIYHKSPGSDPLSPAASEVRTIDIPITIKESIPEPIVTLTSTTKWDGRSTIEIVPQIANLKQMQDAGSGKLKYNWEISGLAAIRSVLPDRLVLTRAQNSGEMTVTLKLSNGGAETTVETSITVREPATDPWVAWTPEPDEKPVDNQFYPRDDRNEGTLFCNGTLAEAVTTTGANPAERNAFVFVSGAARAAWWPRDQIGQFDITKTGGLAPFCFVSMESEEPISLALDNDADSVALRVFADDKPFKTETQIPAADGRYAFAVKLKPGLIKYRVELVSVSAQKETTLHTANNIVCGDAYLIDGQSNALATDWGPDKYETSSEWIRSFGSNNGDTSRGWGDAVRREGGHFQIGCWGMDLAKSLVERHQIPICIINGAAGGTLIEAHQRSADNPADPETIYGRLLNRVQQARLTHGIRGVFWHQGENNQGAQGATGKYGWETYEQFFVDMAGSWQEDFPNIQHYYVFQIWPNACSMGGRPASDRLRDVQRRLPRLYSNMTAIATLGIKPEGGCHFSPAGYAELARQVLPVVEQFNYGVVSTRPATSPNLQRASYTSVRRDEIALEFDQPMAWDNACVSQFYLDGASNLISSGSVSGNTINLKLSAPATSNTISYLIDKRWDSKNLLLGQNQLAALTFFEVPLD